MLAGKYRRARRVRRRIPELIATLKAWAKEPLVHFLLFGAVAYAIYDAMIETGGSVDDRTLTVTASDIDALTDQWINAWKRPPTEAEFAGLIRTHVRGKVLYQESLALGLDVGDIVIERRLAQKIELLAQGLSIPAEPSDQDLKAWYEENPDAFRQPDQYSIAQVFFDPGIRGVSAEDDAQDVLKQLNALDAVPSGFAEYGDRSMLQNYFSGYSEPELRRQFGSRFVDGIVGLLPREWHGPIVSEYGVHLVWIDEFVRLPPPTFDEARALITEQWLAERIAENSERYLDELVSRYEVVIEEVQSPAQTAINGATP
jgi:hypothetical protein